MTAPPSPNPSSSPDAGVSGGLRDWRAVAAGTLLGTTVGGAAINILSASHGWRFVTLAAATGMALLVPFWLSRYPARSSLVTWTTRILLAVAIAAAALAAFGPAGTALPATIAAALLATAAVLIPTAPHDRLAMMLGIAGIALGVAIAGFGVTALLNYGYLIGIASIAIGAAIVGGGVARLLGSRHLSGIAGITFGAAAVGGGVVMLLDNDHLLGIAGIAIGGAAVGGGVAALLNDGYLLGIASIAFGAAVAGLGFAWLLDNDHLLGIATIAGGVAVAGFGVATLLDNGVGRRARHWWCRLTADPATRRPRRP